jgi:hypothetical protein
MCSSPSVGSIPVAPPLAAGQACTLSIYKSTRQGATSVLLLDYVSGYCLVLPSGLCDVTGVRSFTQVFKLPPALLDPGSALTPALKAAAERILSVVGDDWEVGTSYSLL